MVTIFQSNPLLRGYMLFGLVRLSRVMLGYVVSCGVRYCRVRCGLVKFS